MIEHNYFYHAKWHHNDGNGSYSYREGIVTYKSWLRPCPLTVLEGIREFMSRELEERFPNGKVEVTTLNRI